MRSRPTLSHESPHPPSIRKPKGGFCSCLSRLRHKRKYSCSCDYNPNLLGTELLTILSGYFLCCFFLNSFRGHALLSGIWLRVRGYVWTFVESVSYAGMHRSERKRKGYKESRKEWKVGVKGFYTEREKVRRCEQRCLYLHFVSIRVWKRREREN